MSLENKFRLTAQKIVEKFAVGTYTIKRVIGNTYDPVTGVNVVDYEDHLALMVADEISEENFEDVNFTRKHFIVIVAGLDIPIVPMPGDLVVTPANTVHRIVKLEVDQYMAAINMYVEKDEYNAP